MKIVIPVSSVDVARLPLLADVLCHLGGLSAHEITLVPTASVVAEARDTADRLRSVCPSVSISPLDHDPEFGWPHAPNAHFYWAVYQLHYSGNRSPFLWLEVDCPPVSRGWADTINAAYTSAAKPFFGHVVPTPFRDKDGKIVTRTGDTMMMGCGVYAPGIPSDDLIRPLYNDLCKLPPNCPAEPWDVYLRWVMKNRGVAHTDLIADMWNTQNYRMENGQMMGDAAPSNFPGRARSGIVPAEALLVHGCKDRSLYELVLKSAGVVKLPVVKPMPSGPTGAQGEPNLGNAKAVGPTGLEGPLGQVDTALNTPATELIPALLIAHLDKQTGSVSIKAMAEHFNVTKEAVRAALEGSDYEVRPGSAGWVGKKKEVEV